MIFSGIEGLEENQVSFNYIDIKYQIENTSSETAIFRGLQEVVFVVDGKHENLDMFNNNQDFIRDDEEDQGGGEYS